MARVPDPVPGLVFRYGYVWLGDYRRGPVDPAKDRPACIIARVVAGADISFAIAGGLKLTSGDVIALPITRRPQNSDDIAVELTVGDKRACGPDPEEPSWVVVSEFNADIWPNADLSIIPGYG